MKADIYWLISKTPFIETHDPYYINDLIPIFSNLIIWKVNKVSQRKILQPFSARCLWLHQIPYLVLISLLGKTRIPIKSTLAMEYTRMEKGNPLSSLSFGG